MSYREGMGTGREALLEIPFHMIFSERGRLGAARNATRSNAYANRQTCSGQKRLLAWVTTMSRCHQRNICARRSEIISIRSFDTRKQARINWKPRELARNWRPFLEKLTLGFSISLFLNRSFKSKWILLLRKFDVCKLKYVSILNI